MAVISREENQTEIEIDRLLIDLLSHIFLRISSFTNLAQASCVSKQWRKAVKQSIGRKEILSFSGWKMDDESTERIVSVAFNLKELDISRRRWGCQITDAGLNKISMAKSIPNLTSVSLRGMTGITEIGVIQLVSRADSLRHLNNCSVVTVFWLAHFRWAPATAGAGRRERWLRLRELMLVVY